MRRYKSACLACTHLKERPRYGARRCELGRFVVLNDDPASCPVYSPILQVALHPDQLQLFGDTVDDNRAEAT